MSRQHKNIYEYYFMVLAFLYFFIILYITILNRQSKFLAELNLTLFSSYIEFINGNNEFVRDIILNIGLFFPYGFILMNLFHENRKGYIFALVIGLCTSAFIEYIQYMYKIGVADIDDILSNTIGTGIGMVGFVVYDRIIHRCYCVISSMLFVVGLFFVVNQNEVQDIVWPSQFAFEIDNNSKGILSGYAFPYGMDAKDIDFSIILRIIETNEIVELNTVSGIKRDDINIYYDSKFDYSFSGFETELIPNNIRAEIMVDWADFGRKETGLYFINGKIQGTKYNLFDFKDTDLEDFNYDGFLLAQNTDNHCMVYQKEKMLYWIVDENFAFSEDEATKIQFQLWTSNDSRLPLDRIQYGFDNISFDFENYEITNNIKCGKYRVAAKEIPDQYPITYVKTGYYVQNDWVWNEYFRLKN